MKFKDLPLAKPLLEAIAAKGYEQATPIQQQAIPAVLKGVDILAAAQTGTGKTAAFTLPMLQLLSAGEPAKPNQARSLILTPTRELAAQIQESIEIYGAQLPLKSVVVFGGVKINPQMIKLRLGVDILVATPGRLLDLYSQNAVKFDQLEILVLDEADRMLDMGFIRDIRKIIAFLPKKRQNLMFSATFSDEIRALAKTIVNNPQEIAVSTGKTAANSVEQMMHPVDKKQKPALLVHLIREGDWQQVLVFCRTKHGANKLTKVLEAAGVTAAAIHGNKSQGARTKALADFKAGEVRALVATDIAARGLDIDQLPQVVNFDLPQVAEDYVHRIGRTGRAGADGKAYSLVAADEAKQLFDIERFIQAHLKRDYIQGFVPDHDLPTSRPLQASKVNRSKHRKTSSEVSGNRASTSDRPRTSGRPHTGDRARSGDGARSNTRGRRF